MPLRRQRARRRRLRPAATGATATAVPAEGRCSRPAAPVVREVVPRSCEQAPVVYELQAVVGGAGPAEEVTLYGIAAGRDRRGELSLGFHTFGDDDGADLVGELGNAGEQRGRSLGRQRSHQAP